MNAEVRVEIHGRVVGISVENGPSVMYLVEGDDGRRRWVPEYNVKACEV